MPEEASSIDIIELAEILENRKSNSRRIAVFLGSRAGALFRSTDFYEELKTYSTRSLADMDERTRFHECHSVLEDIQRRKTMSLKELRSFIEGEIDAHFDVEEHFAQMVKDDFFKVIITNNIDDIVYVFAKFSSLVSIWHGINQSYPHCLHTWKLSGSSTKMII